MTRKRLEMGDEPFRLQYEPLAITGIGCRFPGGANDPDSFWNILCQGHDAISEIPSTRWDADQFFDPNPAAEGKIYTRHGGFIDNIDRFDAGFFGISPREALWIDPQQRLLLKTAWEAFEDAGMVIDRSRSQSVGVFVGASSLDYARSLSSAMEMNNIEMHTGTGIAFSILANRLSHRFNFNGPSMVVDTACSSSLVAIHLACRSIWLNECEMALAGGCNLMLHPEMYVIFSRMSVLSPEGRSKAFSDSANGFVRAEGAGLILLKPLSRALEDENPIYAVIRGIDVNQDGYTPEALTFPNGKMQKSLMERVYKRFSINPADVTYVEAHGTGTSIGDPIEASAIGSVSRTYHTPENPCFIGSVKTNIGHLESGAGIAGIIKAALMIRYQKIVPNLHFEKPNPDIDFDQLRLRVPQTLMDWPDGRPVTVSVNSFGFGGTNAHAVLSQAPSLVEKATALDLRDAELFCLTAHSQSSLHAYAEKCLGYLDGGKWQPFHLQGICRFAINRRYQHTHRLSIACTTHGHLADGLNKFLRHETAKGIHTAEILPESQHGIVFVFSGQGAHWRGMGRALYAGEPVFRKAVMRCDEILKNHAPWSLIDALHDDSEASRLEDTAVAQPAIFAIQVALTALWDSWGIRPAAVVGHSLGEITAAYVSGILSLADAVRIVYYRSLHMSKTGPGKMLAVGTGMDEVTACLNDYRGRVELAALNTPRSVTLSGDTDAIESLEAFFSNANIFCRFLQVQCPFHSHRMDPIRDDFLAAIEGIAHREPCLPFYSTVKGRQADLDDFSTEYWWDNIRQTVLFAPVIDRLIDQKFKMFAEISAQPVLSGPITQCALIREYKVVVVPSLQSDQPEHLSMLSALGVFHDIGIKCDWKPLYPDTGSHIPFPPYAWDDQSYWQQTKTMENFLRPKCHPLLGQRLSMPEPAWESRIHEWRLPYLTDHRVHGHCLLPGVAYLEMALAAVQEIEGLQYPIFENLKLTRAVFLSDSISHVFQSFYQPELSVMRVYDREETAGSEWTLNAKCSVIPAPKTCYPSLNLDDIRSRCTDAIDQQSCYKEFRQLGFQYGHHFQSIKCIYRGRGEALAEIIVADCLLDDMEKYHAHPAILDACLQTVLGTGTLEKDKNYLPVSVARFHLVRPLQTHMWSYVYAIEKQGDLLTSSILIAGQRGEIIARLHGIQFKGISVSHEPETLFEDILYHYKWTPDQGKPGWSDSEHLLPLSLRTLAEETHSYFATLESFDMPDGIDELCRFYAADALTRMGVKLEAGETFDLNDLQASLKVAENRQPLFQRLLGMLVEDGVLKCQGGQWKVLRPLSDNHPKRLWRTFAQHHPAFYPELMLLKKQAECLPAILRNEVDPGAMLSEEDDFGIYEHLYRDAAYLRNYNLALRFAMERIIGALPRRRKLRILEVGAGTGGTAAYVLPLLAGDDHEYFFTDQSEDYLQAGARKLQGSKNVHYQVLDIGIDPETQDFENHCFDIIICVHTLHTVDDALQAMDHIKELLTPSGILLLVEPASNSKWAELVFGRIFPYISWRAILAESAFEDISPVGSIPLSTPYASRFLMARGPRFEIEIPQNFPDDKAPGTWLIFCDQRGSGVQLADWLSEYGDRCIMVSPGDRFQQIGPDNFKIAPASADDMQSLIDTVWPSQSGHSLAGILHMWSLDIDDAPEPSTAAIQQIYETTCINAMLLTQALPLEKNDPLPPLWLITRCTQSLGNAGQPFSPFQAPLWGMGRVMENEIPNMRLKKVDLGAETPEDSLLELRQLLNELHSDMHEDEIALRGSIRYVNRLNRTSVNKIAGSDSRLEGDFGFRLETQGDGVINNMRLRKTRRPKPGPKEVLIEPRAAGLNFSDVMKALNLYPGLPEGTVPLGLECAGIVVEVGDEVAERQPGDRVLAVGQFCFGSHVLTHETLIMDIPDSMGFAEAATIPVAFLTAHYALINIGRLKQGERVLIHSATGGVGQAAIQIARHIGAEIFATAGTHEKRQWLHDMGIKWVMDSRTLNFADEIAEHTGGEGVDVILNSLSGQAIARGLSILKHNGRFLEIGKRDIYQDNPIGLLPFQKNLSFCAIDLDSIIRTSPDTVKTIQHDCFQALKQGIYSPLPFRAFPVDMAADAFRYMAQARHLGKIVLTINDHRPKLAPPPVDKIVLQDNATYLIIGGFGGYGLLLAQWLADRGARHIALLGRSGANTEEAWKTLVSLRHRGAQVKEIQADASCAKDVVRALSDLKRTMPPLRGIIHAAMVLKDKLLTDITIEDMTAVMDSKIKGAWLFHHHTRMIPLDFFVVFSSMTSLTGTRGQGNYAAANAFLDAFAHYRASKGLPGLSINWGRLGDVGRLAHDKQLASWFDHAGVKSIPAAQVLRSLDHLLQLSPVQAAVMDIDWGHLGNIVDIFRESNRFRHLYHMEANNAIDDIGGVKMASLLRKAEAEERTNLLQAALTEQIAKVLGAQAESLDTERPLTQFGLDSLMVMELSNWITKNLNVALPVMEIIRGPSIDQLTRILLKSFDRTEGANTPSPGSAPTLKETVGDVNHQISENIDEIPESQLDVMLEAIMSEDSPDEN